MRILASTKVRLFLVTWILFTIHFATNVVREHYPAFTIVDHGTFRVDEYEGFHSDIFRHEDGHSYIGNNVAASVVTAVPLLVFDPILDAIERHERGKIEREGVGEVVYRTHHTNSRLLLELTKEAGLSLRFGAATVVTSAFLMAPLSALLVVLLYHVLRQRQVERGRAVFLCLLFAFGTPMLFRTGVLNHNMFVMYATFVAFHLLWVRPGRTFPVPLGKRVAAGFLCGCGLALDYSGVVPLLVIFGYLIASRTSTASWRTAILESIPFVLASVPPVLFLLYSQWAMFGNPFLPGQYWMPDTYHTPDGRTWTNPYSTDGFRGFTLPAADLSFLNLFHPAYGLYTYGPLLMIALVPAHFYRRGSLVLPRRERRFVALYFLAFLLFCSANQYSRIQENSGFRYMVPLLPVLYLSACDHLARMQKRWLVLLSIPVVLHSWVIAAVREPIPMSWEQIFTSGPQLPWLHVLRSTVPKDRVILQSPWTAVAILGLAIGFCWWIWRLGEARAARGEAAR